MTLVLLHSISQGLLCPWVHSLLKMDQLVSKNAPSAVLKHSELFVSILLGKTLISQTI